jgi:folate-binding protein YgfZ
MLPVQAQSAMATMRQRGGYFSAQEFGLVEIYGKDAERFLQAQTTNDVKALDTCCGQISCLLDRKAYVKAFFHLYRRHESFRIIAEKTQISTIISHLEDYRFADKVEFLDLSDTGQFFAVQGPDASYLVHKAEKKHQVVCQHDLTDAELWGVPIHVFRKSVTGENGYFLWVSQLHANEFIEKAVRECEGYGFVSLAEADLEIARLEAGLPRFAVDFGNNNLLPETSLLETVASFSKGCFLGQEVLARVKSHGAPTQALVGLKIDKDHPLNLPRDSRLIQGNQEIGKIKTNGYSPTLGQNLAFAMVKRDVRVVGRRLTVQVDQDQFEVIVSDLAFYKPESLTDRARKICDEALKSYIQESEHEGAHEVESPSVVLLRRAIELDPSLEDAYEALGVILSKRGNLDEAIELMSHLASINQDSIMAHTNLSVFYLEKGLKEEAEEEKAISMAIRMRVASKNAVAAQEQEKLREMELEELSRRKEMFKQVLAIDPNDLLASYGYGSCLVESGEFGDSLAYLKNAVSIKPSHTVAYVALARAYRGLGNKEDALKTINSGIEVASKRGDMMPLRELEQLRGDVSSNA